jgi:DNA-binding NarL/FixJ family response regulator
VDPADAIAPWPRVLLVEDDQANRRRIRAILSEEGISVIGEASDGATGVRLARELGPDVILMDLRMPFMGGLEATRAIKEKLPNTQVIILTSYDGPLPSRSAEQAGAYAYLVKGCSAKLLREMIYQAWKYRVGLQRADEEQTADGLTSMLFREDESQATFDAAADPPGPLDPFASGDPLEPAEPMPDQIPEDFVERFGREARQTVRYRTSRRYRWIRQARSGLREFRDREVWTVAVIVFGMSLFGLALIAALGYMVVLWPWTGLFIVAPIMVLLPFSLWMATRIVQRERKDHEEQGKTFSSGW